MKTTSIITIVIASIFYSLGLWAKEHKSIIKLDTVPIDLNGKWKVISSSNRSSDISGSFEYFHGKIFEFQNNKLIVDNSPTCVKHGGLIHFQEISGFLKPLNQNILKMKHHILPGMKSFHLVARELKYLSCTKNNGELTQWDQSIQEKKVYHIECTNSKGWNFTDPVLFRNYLMIDNETILASYDDVYLCLNKIIPNISPIISEKK